MTYPVKQHCINVAKQLGATEGAFFVKGFAQPTHADSDTEMPFKQCSNFMYVAGIAEPDYEIVYDIAAQKATLLTRFIDEDEAVWVGAPPSLSDLLAASGADEVKYTRDLEAVLTAINPVKVYIMDCQAASVLGKFEARAEPTLRQAIHEARVLKDEWEVAAMREANRITCAAHVELIKSIKVGDSERDVAAKFGYEIRRAGGTYEAYNSICARGTHASTLHYVRNDAEIEAGSEVVLVDAGAVYKGYAADITRTFPVGKTFSPEARAIYQLVLDMQKACFAACKPGEQWENIHEISYNVCAEGLIKLGILKGTLAEVRAVHAPATFYPHGIGHFLGIDVHDTNGYPAGVERFTTPGFRYLRARREMKPGMVFTVEPGVYFVEGLLALARKDAKLSAVIDFDVVAKYQKVGGVRIEDNIVITADGFDNLTDCVKEIADIEALRP